MRRPTFIAAAFLAGHILFAHWSPGPAWGLDLLAFYPPWIQPLFALCGALVLWPRSRDALLDLIDGVGRLPAPLLRGGLVLGGLGLFVGLRSATALLGDGNLYLNELPSAAEAGAFRVDRAPLVFWLVGQLYTLLPFPSPLLAYQLYSCAAGLLYLLLVWPTARYLARHNAERGLLAAFLLTPGFLAIFCGYVETYALLLPGILLYVLCGYGVLERRWPLWPSAGAFGALVALHLSSINLAPSLALLALLHGRGADLRGWTRTLLSLGAAPLVFLALLLAPGIDLQAYLTSVDGDNLLPLWSAPDLQIHNYRLFSVAHLLDFANLLLLVAPAPLMSLLAGVRPGRQRSDLFLLSAAFFPLLSAFLSNPGIGAFRDWDLLSLPALPLSIWAARALAARSEEERTLRRTGLVLGATAALHTLLWLGLNAHADASAARFARGLEQSEISNAGRGYGWETLGIYYRERGRSEHSLAAFLQATEADPNPRYWTSAGDQYAALGRFAAAARAYERALVDKPDHAAVWTALAEARFQAGLVDESLGAWQVALRIAPDDIRANFSLCLAYNKLNRPRDAVAQCQRALALQPNAPFGLDELLKAHLHLAELDAARQVYLRLKPVAPDRAHPYADLFE